MTDLALLSALTHKPTSVSDLCDHFHVDRRVLQKAREALEEDYEVLSDQRGYWIANGPEEYVEVLKRDYRELKADARRLAKRRRVMKKKWPFHQAQLPGFEEAA